MKAGGDSLKIYRKTTELPALHIFKLIDAIQSNEVTQFFNKLSFLVDDLICHLMYANIPNASSELSIDKSMLDNPELLLASSNCRK